MRREKLGRETIRNFNRNNQQLVTFVAIKPYDEGLCLALRGTA